MHFGNQVGHIKDYVLMDIVKEEEFLEILSFTGAVIIYLTQGAGGIFRFQHTENLPPSRSVWPHPPQSVWTQNFNPLNLFLNPPGQVNNDSSPMSVVLCLSIE